MTSRLFEILYILLERRQVRAQDLASRLGVSVRTVYRDVETLSMAGVPIYATPGKGGGVSLLPGYAFDKALLSDAEQNQLLLAVQSLKAADQRVDPLLQKLGAAFQKAPRSWIEVDFSRWGMARADAARFELLKTAILERQVLRLTYCGASGTLTRRNVHPLKLIYKDKHWYLQAYCLQAEDFRLFKVGRMAEAAPTGEVFPRDYDHIPPIELDTTSSSPVRLKLKIGKALAFRVYDEFDRAGVTLLPNGDFLVETAFPMDGWVVGYLFSFGVELEILEPAALRRQLADYAQAIAAHHRT